MTPFDFLEAEMHAAEGLTEPAARLAARRAVVAREFSRAVDRLGWTRLDGGGGSRPVSSARFFVVGVAPWNRSDLIMLDGLALIPAVRERKIPILLFTADEILTFDQLAAVAPGIHPVQEFPILVEYRRGKLIRIREGAAARRWCDRYGAHGHALAGSIPAAAQ